MLEVGSSSRTLRHRVTTRYFVASARPCGYSFEKITTMRTTLIDSTTGAETILRLGEATGLRWEDGRRDVRLEPIENPFGPKVLPMSPESNVTPMSGIE